MNGKPPYHDMVPNDCACHLEWAPPELLLEIASDDEDLIRELVADFQRDTTGRIENMRSALAQGDIAILRAEAHAIKGGARQVGAMIVADTCQQIESMSLDAPAVEFAGRLSRLETEFAQICGAMEVHLNRGENQNTWSN